MIHLRLVRRWMLALPAAVVVVVGHAAPAWADASIPLPTAAEKSYVMPYALVVLACALGLMLVCRSSHRTTEIKQTEDD